MSGLGACLSALALSVGVLAAGHTAYGQERLRKGPWVMNQRPGRVTILAERGTPGAVSVQVWREGARGSAPVTVHSAGPGVLHELVVSGLTAGLRYRYTLSGPGLTPQEGHFSTAPAGAESFRFVLYGDTRSHAAAHAAIAESIRREAPDFVVHTGDLVSDGRRERDWQQFFEIERELLRDTLFIPVIGNHELRPPSHEGIENFRKYIHCDPDSPNPELDYSLHYGHIRMILSNAYENWAEAPMRPWLEQQLARARREGPDDFLLVVMHWGMHSSGPHGPNNTLRRAGLVDLFRRYNVDLVVAGHDHIYERGEERGLRFVVTGGGGAPLYRQRRPFEFTDSFVSAHHYIRVDADPQRLQLTALRADGTVLDRFDIRHTRPAATARPEPALEHVVIGANAPVDDDDASPTGPGLEARAQSAEAASATPRRRRRRPRGELHARTCLCTAPGAPGGPSGVALGPLAASLAWALRRRRHSPR